MTTATSPVVAKTLTLAEITGKLEAMDHMLIELAARIAKLEESSKSTKKSEIDMTDDHARQVLNGDLKDLRHGDAAQKLGLSYGQVYSCRLGYTFKAIHKELESKGYKNPWKK